MTAVTKTCGICLDSECTCHLRLPYKGPPPLPSSLTTVTAANSSVVAVTADWSPRPVLPSDAAARNEYPLWDGLFGYFQSALAEVARLSHIANEQHNPGEPLHWARGKSMDHKNKIIKHLLDAELLDTDNTLHATKLAWRSLALLQEILERRGAPRAPNAY